MKASQRNHWSAGWELNEDTKLTLQMAYDVRTDEMKPCVTFIKCIFKRHFFIQKTLSTYVHINLPKRCISRHRKKGQRP